MDSDKSMKIIILILTIAIIAQGYMLYDLNNTMKSSSNSEVKEKKTQLISQNLNPTNNSHTNPFREFRLMQQEFDRIFSSFNTHFSDDSFFKNSFDDDFFHKPLIDMAQTSSEYTIKMDIPGVKNSNIKTSIEDRVLNVKAEVDETKENNSSSFVQKERYINKFQRTLTLPSNADSSKMKTDYKDGVLTITIPKL